MGFVLWFALTQSAVASGPLCQPGHGLAHPVASLARQAQSGLPEFLRIEGVEYAYEFGAPDGGKVIAVRIDFSRPTGVLEATHKPPSWSIPRSIARAMQLGPQEDGTIWIPDPTTLQNLARKQRRQFRPVPVSHLLDADPFFEMWAREEVPVSLGHEHDYTEHLAGIWATPDGILMASFARARAIEQARHEPALSRLRDDIQNARNEYGADVDRSTTHIDRQLRQNNPDPRARHDGYADAIGDLVPERSKIEALITGGKELTPSESLALKRILDRNGIKDVPPERIETAASHLTALGNEERVMPYTVEYADRVPNFLKDPNVQIQSVVVEPGGGLRFRAKVKFKVNGHLTARRLRGPEALRKAMGFGLVEEFKDTGEGIVEFADPVSLNHAARAQGKKFTLHDLKRRAGDGEFYDLWGERKVLATFGHEGDAHDFGDHLTGIWALPDFILEGSFNRARAISDAARDPRLRRLWETLAYMKTPFGREVDKATADIDLMLEKPKKERVPPVDEYDSRVRKLVPDRETLSLQIRLRFGSAMTNEERAALAEHFDRNGVRNISDGEVTQVAHELERQSLP